MIGMLIFSYIMITFFNIYSHIFGKKELVNRTRYFYLICTILFASFFIGEVAIVCLMLILTVMGIYEYLKCSNGNKYIGIIFGATVYALVVISKHVAIYMFGLFAIMCIITFTFYNKINKIKSYKYAYCIFVIAYGFACFYRVFYYCPQILIETMGMATVCDAVAYLVGKSFGKKHIFKNSPNKTLEGCLGGFLGVMLVYSISMLFLTELRAFAIWYQIIIIIVAWIGAITGDLLFSTCKRMFDVKDYSHILGKHGGILDRFDNWIFLSAIVFMMQTIYYVI